MTPTRLISERAAGLDVAAVFDWYDGEKPGLGAEFLDELHAAYSRIQGGPLRYQDLRAAIRQALLKWFPYAVYFVVEPDVVVVVAVLHAKRDPAEWQQRCG